MIRVFVAAPTSALRLALRASLDGPGIAVVGDGPTPEGAPADVDVVVIGDADHLAASASARPDAGARAIVAVADDQRPARTLRRMPLRGWAIVGREASAGRAPRGDDGRGSGLHGPSRRAGHRGARVAARAAHATRARGPGAPRPGALQPSDRRASRHQRAHGEVPRGLALREARGREPHRGGEPRRPPRPDHALSWGAWHGAHDPDATRACASRPQPHGFLGGSGAGTGFRTGGSDRR